MTRDEIASAVQILRANGDASAASRFPVLVLNEPPKQEVLNYKPGSPFRREAFAVVYERGSNITHEAVLDLVNKRLISWKLVPGVEPPFLVEDFLLTSTVVKADSQWQKAMARRGITDFKNVQVDAWSAGYYALPGEDRVRVVRALSYYRGELKNPYSHPIEGVVAYVVDLNKRRVLRLIDTGVSVGRLAQPLQPLVDAPNNAVFFDALFAGDFGTAVSVPRAVALYERDGGILWKHVDYLSTHNESRRARELVLMWVANVGNYEYAFNWVFHQDGTLEMEVDLTGIMQAKGVDPKAAHGSHGPDMFGHKVGEGVEAVHHQHFFNFRLDLDVDGSADNSVVELNTGTLPRGPSNPYHNAFTTTSTLFHHELEAQRDVSIPSSRKWAVISNSARNGLGEPTGYMLVPGENAVPYALPEASVRKRAGFVNHHLWVTKYAPGEMNAAGFYINQSKGGDGLTKWTRSNRSIDDQDVVLWYTMGITHIPRPEEWPVMTVHKAGFKLIPRRFFDRNPALDVPVAPNK